MPTVVEGEMTAAPKQPIAQERIKRQEALTEAAFKKHGRARVTLRQGMAGARFCRERGDVIEVPGDEAKRLIEAGIAVPVPKDDKRTATVTPSEKRG